MTKSALVFALAALLSVSAASASDLVVSDPNAGVGTTEMVDPDLPPLQEPETFAILPEFGPVPLIIEESEQAYFQRPVFVAFQAQRQLGAPVTSIGQFSPEALSGPTQEMEFDGQIFICNQATCIPKQ